MNKIYVAILAILAILAPASAAWSQTAPANSGNNDRAAATPGSQAQGSASGENKAANGGQTSSPATTPPVAGSGVNSSAAAGGGPSGAGTTASDLPQSDMDTSDPAALQSEIQTALQREPTLANDTVRVNITPDAILLSGSAATAKEKLTAKRIAQSYSGNRRVVDKITVTGRANAAAGNGLPGESTPPAAESNEGKNTRTAPAGSSAPAAAGHEGDKGRTATPPPENNPPR